MKAPLVPPLDPLGGRQLHLVERSAGGTSPSRGGSPGPGGDFGWIFPGVGRGGRPSWRPSTAFGLFRFWPERPNNSRPTWALFPHARATRRGRRSRPHRHDGSAQTRPEAKPRFHTAIHAQFAASDGTRSADRWIEAKTPAGAVFQAMKSRRSRCSAGGAGPARCRLPSGRYQRTVPSGRRVRLHRYSWTSLVVPVAHQDEVRQLGGSARRPPPDVVGPRPPPLPASGVGAPTVAVPEVAHHPFRGVPGHRAQPDHVSGSVLHAALDPAVAEQPHRGLRGDDPAGLDPAPPGTEVPGIAVARV